MTLDDCVKEFCKVFRMRKEGKLSPPDLTVHCQICGNQIIGDESIDFIEGAIVCKSCVKVEVIGITR